MLKNKNKKKMRGMISTRKKKESECEDENLPADMKKNE